MKTILAAVLLSATLLTSAHADPVAAATCVKKGSPTFLIVGISTGFFAPSQQKILDYDTTVGEFGPNGTVKTSKKYEQESNMKIFNDASQASQWVHSNTVVIPLIDEADHNRVTAVVLVDLAHRKATLVDADYEKLEVLDCQEN